MIDEDKKDEKGFEAVNENNFLNNVIKTIKQNFPEIIVIADDLWELEEEILQNDVAVERLKEEMHERGRA